MNTPDPRENVAALQHGYRPSRVPVDLPVLGYYALLIVLAVTR